MNIIVSSDRPVDVHVHMYFTDNNVYVTRMRLVGNNISRVRHTVVGRWPEDLLKLELEYNDCRHAHPIEPDGNGGLKEIRIYGGRDQWSQLLRDKALSYAET